MKSVHKPVRECICCGQKFYKQEMLRIVKNESGIFADSTGKAQGRGAYLCLSPVCREKLIKGRRLDRAFKGRIDQSVYETVLAQAESRCAESYPADR